MCGASTRTKGRRRQSRTRNSLAVTALKSNALERFIKAPAVDIAAALVFGPDAGLVRERAHAIAVNVVPDVNDPFNAIEFTDQDLKGDPAQLADEAAALSFLGGRRLIRVRTAGDGAFEAAKRLIDGVDGGHVKSNALVVIEAGDLAKTSRLRRLFDAAKHAVSIACYEDKPEDLAALAVAMAAKEGLKFETDALEFAVSLLGADRGISRSELEKLILFVGPAETDRSTITICADDVRACLVDSEDEALHEAAAAALNGDARALAASLRRLSAGGASEVGLVRALQREVTRLSFAQNAIADGASPRDAMQKLRPPVFYGDQRAFSQRLKVWSRARLAAASDMLLEAEAGAKATGAPGRAIVERAALRLAALAGDRGER